jgi:hypothetical protein
VSSSLFSFAGGVSKEVTHLFKRSFARFRQEKESPDKWQQAKYRKKNNIGAVS